LRQIKLRARSMDGSSHGVSEAQRCQLRGWIAVPAFNRLAPTGRSPERRGYTAARFRRQGGNHVRALELHKKLLTLWNAIVSDNLPACTRYSQSLQGLPTTFSRAASPAQQAAIRKALERLGASDRQTEAAE
jgi:hypothetical protein